MTALFEGPPTTLAARPSRSVERWHKPVFILFLMVWAMNMALVCLRIQPAAGWRWAEGLLPVFATATTLLALGRRLPLQNVFMTALVILLISAAILFLGAKSGIPFGPYVYSGLLGERIFDVLPWSIPLVWIIVIVNGRGIARLMMRPWRKTNYYGFWVIGLTCLLAMTLDLGLEPFAVFVKGYWIWQTPKSVPAWYTAPWVNFLGWLVTALGILVFSIPWLINKQPVKQPIDYHPLILWLLINSWILAGNAMHHLWPAVVVTLTTSTIATVFAIRGAQW